MLLSQRVYMTGSEVYKLKSIKEPELADMKVQASVELAKLVEEVQQLNQDMANSLAEVQNSLDNDKNPNFQVLGDTLQDLAPRFERFDPPGPGKSESDVPAEIEHSASGGSTVPPALGPIGIAPAAKAQPAAAEPDKEGEPVAITKRRLPGHPLLWAGALPVILLPLIIMALLIVLMTDKGTHTDATTQVDRRGVASLAPTATSPTITCADTDSSAVVYGEDGPWAYLSLKTPDGQAAIWRLEGVVPAESGDCIFAYGDRAGQTVPAACFTDQAERPDCPPRQKLYAF